MGVSLQPAGVRLQQVLDAARAGYWDWLPEADRLWVDDRLAGWLGARPTTMAAFRALTADREQRDGAACYRVRGRWIEERRAQTEDGHVVAACLDVSDRHRRELALVWEAEHDPLTGLLSRRCFDRLLERALADTGDRSGRVGLLMVDLDCFKAVNDGVGHAGGDRVLRAVANRLRSLVRRSDPLARWGGDEFTLILESDAPGGRAASVAHRLLTAIRLPVALAGDRLVVRASIGIAVGQDGEAPPSLARRADRALYAAKAAGGDRWCLDGSAADTQ